MTDPTALAAYTGTGTVNVTENALATSNATGGGNLEVNVHSTAQSTVTVIYHYNPDPQAPHAPVPVSAGGTPPSEGVRTALTYVVWLPTTEKESADA